MVEQTTCPLAPPFSP